MKIFENLFDEHFNSLIIEELQNVYWLLASDPPEDNKSDSGFVSFTHNNFEGDPPEPCKINFYATVIFDRIKKEYPVLDEYFPVRFLWNYYNTSSSGTLHPDGESKDLLSIIYYINNNDGGTLIEDEFIQSKQGRAVVFDSNKLHKGIGPKTYPNRYVLNILLLKKFRE